MKHETIIIERIAFGGDGIGMLQDGRVCFVPFTSIGDEVEVAIIKEAKNFSKGKVVSFKTKSPNRVNPACPYYMQCGGCQYQHLNYENEIDIKKNQLQDVLQRIAKYDEEIKFDEVIINPSPYNYRNKIVLQPFLNSNKTISYGFTSVDNQVQTIDYCHLADDILNEKILLVDKTKEAKRNNANLKFAKATIRKKNDDAIIFYNKAKKNEPWLSYQINNNDFKVPLNSFYQVNSYLNDKMFDLVNRWTSELELESAIDAFCGVGFLTLACNSKKKIGLELNEESIKAAKINGKHSKASFVQCDVQKKLGKYLQNMPKFNSLLLLDPPRGGLSTKVIDEVLANEVEYVLYVSCYISTMARDLNSLKNKYKIYKLALIDMFSKTFHFETVILLKRKYDG